MKDDLLSRLRERVVIQKGKEWTAIINGEEQRFSTGEIVQVFPLGEEATDAIESLTAEISRLKAIMLDEDLIWDAISDSLDMDWTPKDGARAVVRRFQKEIEEVNTVCSQHLPISGGPYLQSTSVAAFENLTPILGKGASA